MSDKVANALLWGFIALYVLLGAARLLQNPELQRLTPFISVTILTAFAVVHGVRRYGCRRLLVFFLLTFVISWSYETASILTGFPFGHYVYGDKLGLKLWLVPLVIMPAYFSMGYLALTLARRRRLLRRAVQQFSRLVSLRLHDLPGVRVVSATLGRVDTRKASRRTRDVDLTRAHVRRGHAGPIDRFARG